MLKFTVLYYDRGNLIKHELTELGELISLSHLLHSHKKNHTVKMESKCGEVEKEIDYKY